MTLELNLKNKIISLLFLCFPVIAYADPEINNELVPPGEAMYVTDSSILNQLNLGPDDEPVWCYSNLANSLIISSADREREKCSLQMSQQIEELTARHVFEIDTLNLEIKSLKKTVGLVVGSAICREISKSIKKRQNVVTNVTNIVRKLRNKIQ